MAKYRTAIIACGNIARVHARAWLNVPGTPVEIGAIADSHPDALREFGEFHNVPAERRYRDYREMLEKERPDFVDVCSWHGMHAEMVVATAARRPRAILCQKPMALSMGDADRMVVACERNGVKLFIAFQRPHHATWLKARDLIREGAIGKVIQVVCDDGGNLLNTNSHNIRLALFLMGEPRAEWVMGAVERTTERMERGFPAEDAALGVVGCDNGATILIMGALKLAHRLGQGARVIGTEGMMELDTGRPPADQWRTDGDQWQPEGSSAKYNDEWGSVRYLNATTGGWKSVEAKWHDAWAHQAWEAYEWAEGRLKDPISDARNGYAAQEIMMALYESARRKQRIELPLRTRVNPLAYAVEHGELPVEWPGPYEVRARIVRGEGMTWGDGGQ
ncbi:MAG: Gfo/Idh/MocA family oxidoreductase [Chloroflexota bacterium]|nr:MAG: Gfo/Idh/MocA family oxidoreductase [Chloroflexota bacterium]